MGIVIGVPKETMVHETRVALSPEIVKKIVSQGHQVRVASQAGVQASMVDRMFEHVGAQIVSQEDALASDLIVKVRAPSLDELQLIKPSAILIGMLNPFDSHHLNALAKAGITSFALEAAPRTTRAQSMDVLSSQANIAGYKAVMLAAHFYQKFFPMLMTAAGTVKAARVVVLGVGVAGLQAIATAKRLGALIEASDVRPSVKEQVESLGGKFIEVSYDTPEEMEAAQGVGGYAKPMPSSWLLRQQQEVAKRVAQADIVIATALIPGRAAPTLITEEMVQSMKPGSVIVDIAAGKGAQGGGNCPLTETDLVVQKYGVTLVGYTNLPALLAADASSLYARNMFDFLKLILNKEGQIEINLEDDIVAACLMTQDYQVKK